MLPSQWFDVLASQCITTVLFLCSLSPPLVNTLILLVTPKDALLEVILLDGIQEFESMFPGSDFPKS